MSKTNRWHATFDYNKRLAQRAEQIGFDISLLAELNLNDIKGATAPVLECWTTAAAIASVTEKVELMNAIRPGFRLPAITAKMSANIDHDFERPLQSQHRLRVVGTGDARVRRHVGRPRPTLRAHARVHRSDAAECGPKKSSATKAATTKSRRRISNRSLSANRGRSSTRAANPKTRSRMISRYCDGYLMHGDPPENARPKVEEMERRRRELGLEPMVYGIAAYVICRKSDAEVKKEIDRICDVKDTAGYFGFKDFTTQSQARARVVFE